MLPFDYLAQDTGTLGDYYYNSIYAVVLDGHPFVYLRGADGTPILFFSALTNNSYNGKSRSNSFDYCFYKVNFSGDFDSNDESAFFGASLNSGTIISGDKDSSSTKYEFIGASSGICWDRPSYFVSCNGLATGINKDQSQTYTEVNSGEWSGILLDRPTYFASLGSGTATGTLLEISTTSINFSGVVNPAFKEHLSIAFSFIGGKAGKGSVLYKTSGSDFIYTQFSFIGGSAYQ